MCYKEEVHKYSVNNLTEVFKKNINMHTTVIRLNYNAKMILMELFPIGNKYN